MNSFHNKQKPTSTELMRKRSSSTVLKNDASIWVKNSWVGQNKNNYGSLLYQTYLMTLLLQRDPGFSRGDSSLATAPWLQCMKYTQAVDTEETAELGCFDPILLKRSPSTQNQTWYILLPVITVYWRNMTSFLHKSVRWLRFQLAKVWTWLLFQRIFK